MALPPPDWTLSRDEIDAIMSTPLSLKDSFLDKVMAAEAQHVEAGIRHALGRWVSELEPVLMYRAGRTRPYGVTAKGHNEAYIDIEWDENFYVRDRPATYPVRLYSRT
ncbi:hypothetical protein ACRQ5Q_24510 [Bradyrhizobium sp. PMVTL-01]|uniref:hypothetical protein n=1 Tax=Bradyrhizobium sp. PMVTL-01 TaxID=3434999 RepID=UPI003F6EDC47